jgi:general secretion pathway protein D
VVVNPSSNTLIIQGSPTEYQQWFGLLQELDRPPRSAMVTVTIAEVRLNTGEQLGFEWLLNEFKLGNLLINLSTLGAFGTTGIGGLSAVITSAGGSSARAVLNALASTSRVRVLANPTVMARNGEAAYIQVGSEVPVVSSQQTTGGATTGVPGGELQPNVLQTIQYRQTGVILKVRPVIHAGGRIDLDVEQEVSSAAATKTGVSASPTISTRRVSTKLSIVDGSTVLLGGLMTETASNADTGVPLLKDVPYAGGLFRSSDNTRDRTELVMLITPYVIADEFEARTMSDAFRRQFTWDASTPMQTLRPERPVDPASGPGGAVDGADAARKPYILPPAETPAAEQPAGAGGARSAPASGGGPRPNFGSVAAPAAASAPSAAAASSPQRSSPRSSPIDGAPVTDPQLLKELQNAVKPK